MIQTMPELPTTSDQKHEMACCIAGGGPAGMMLGFLLARAGVDVLVLEKHGDFLRDFRGDTIHPSTMEVMHELGLLDEFLKRPHQEMQKFEMQIGVLWMRISRHPDDPHQLLGRFDRGRALIMIDRHDYWQCGFLIRKGGYEELKSRGIARFHDDLVAIAPFLRDRVSELADWDQV